MDVPAVSTTTTLNLPTVNGTLIASDNSGNVTYSGTTTFSGNATFNAGLVPSSSFLRNRIINGDMRIDQRNAGACVTGIVGSIFAVDRFYFFNSQASRFTAQQNAGAVTPPPGFTNYYGATSSSSYSSLSTDTFTLGQAIEGFNVSDFAFGTAAARAITLSFWVRSSLTGLFGGAVLNGSLNRSYPYTFTVSSANTWEQKTVTIPGDTTGTWQTTNGGGMYVAWDLGSGSNKRGTAGAWVGSGIEGVTGTVSVVGTNGATFYLTGVQLEVGSVATPFERRQYGQELALCQRYARAMGGGMLGRWTNNTRFEVFTAFQPMRVSPSCSFLANSALMFRVGIQAFTASNFTLVALTPTPNGVGLVVDCSATAASSGEFAALLTDIFLFSSEL